MIRIIPATLFVSLLSLAIPAKALSEAPSSVRAAQDISFCRHITDKNTPASGGEAAQNIEIVNECLHKKIEERARTFIPNLQERKDFLAALESFHRNSNTLYWHIYNSNKFCTPCGTVNQDAHLMQTTESLETILKTMATEEDSQN